MKRPSSIVKPAPGPALPNLLPALLPSLLLALLVAANSRTAAAQDASIPVRQVVLDIISFTRWPQPHAPLRLCIVGRPAYAEAFSLGEVRAGGVLLVPARMHFGDPDLGAACDVVYQGALAPPERSQVLRALSGHPVLTVGEAGSDCGETTMFCLQVSGLQVSFASNLDAIARSGVRLNPRVLLLGRRPPAGAPP